MPATSMRTMMHANTFFIGFPPSFIFHRLFPGVRPMVPQAKSNKPQGRRESYFTMIFLFWT